MKKTIIVRTSAKLAGKELAYLSRHLAKTHACEPQIEQVINKDLLAGFVVSLDGVEYDYSLDGALNRLSSAL